MGRDKLSLEVGGVPILRRIYDVLDEACDEVLVVAGACDLSGLPEEAWMVRDLRPAGLGPLAGLESGLYHARHEQTFVAAGDMPFVSRDLVCESISRLRGSRAHAVALRVGGRLEPLCAAYSRKTLVDVGGALDEGVRAMRDLLGRLPEVEEIPEEEIRRFGDPRLLTMNVNSPQDLARARAVAEGGYGGYCG